MRALWFPVLFGALLRAEAPPKVPAPFYTPSSIVNAASYQAGPLAPNAIGTIYGRDLAFTTRAVTGADMYNGTLPTTLLGTGVRVMIGGTLAYLYYVSPTQINFLVPSTLGPGSSRLQLVLDGKAAESVRVELAATSPALFTLNPETVLAVHLDGNVVSAGNPARAGEIVVLYANGLGATRPRIHAGQVAQEAASIDKRDEFILTLNGVAVDPKNILYCGVAPGFAGLYQINLKLPADLPANPEVRIGFADTISPAGLLLRAEAGNP